MSVPRIDIGNLWLLSHIYHLYFLDPSKSMLFAIEIDMPRPESGKVKDCMLASKTSNAAIRIEPEVAPKVWRVIFSRVIQPCLMYKAQDNPMLTIDVVQGLNVGRYKF